MIFGIETQTTFKNLKYNHFNEENIALFNFEMSAKGLMIENILNKIFCNIHKYVHVVIFNEDVLHKDLIFHIFVCGIEAAHSILL